MDTTPTFTWWANYDHYTLSNKYTICNGDLMIGNDASVLMQVKLCLQQKVDNLITSTCPMTSGSYDSGAYYAACTASTSSVTNVWTSQSGWFMPSSPAKRLREILQSRMAPVFISSRKPIVVVADVPEMRARETLRRILGEKGYRLFLKNGFVTVRGKSGRFYQLYPGQKFTSVWENGKMIEQLCVVLSGAFPATDELLMRYVILLNDENHFRSLANKQPAYFVQARQRQIDLRPLHEIFATIKKAA